MKARIKPQHFDNKLKDMNQALKHTYKQVIEFKQKTSTSQTLIKRYKQ